MTATTYPEHHRDAVSPRFVTEIVEPTTRRRVSVTAALFACAGIALAVLAIACIAGVSAAPSFREGLVAAWFAGVALFAAWFVLPPA